MSATTTRSARPSPRVAITREEPIYHPGRPYGFFADTFRSRFLSDEQSRARLERHADEIRVEARAQRTQAPEIRSVGGDTVPVSYERRSWLDLGQGGYGTPPLWLIQDTAVAPRPERCLAGLIDSAPLPRGCSSVNVPRLTQGTSVGVIAPATPGSSTDILDAATSSRVVEISGTEDVPIQLLNQSPTSPLAAHLDRVLMKDLTSAYDAQLEGQLIIGVGGTGPGAQLLGVTNVPGAGSVSYTSGSPTAIGAYPIVGQALGTVSDARKIKPEALLMRFGRWVWFTTSEDEEGRPLGCPDSHQPAPITAPGLPDPIGSLVNVPAFGSEAIGTGANADVIIACRPSDLLLWESAPRLDIFDEVLSSTMEVRVQLRCYAAAITGRWPSGICVLGGTGLAVQTNE